MTPPSLKVLDCRGVEIEVGCKVVSAGFDGRLHEYIVRALERQPLPSWWVNVRLLHGGVTTPDRCAVVRKVSK